MNANISGIFIITDPDQEKQGLYKVGKTTNIVTTISQLNLARANKDFRAVNFQKCSDLANLNKAAELVKQALKKKFVNNSTEWIKVDDTQALAKIISQIQSLVDIANDD
jgi:hypothetical protein